MSLSAADEALLKRYYECKILSLCGRASETSELRRPEQAAATSIRLFQRFYAATSVAARDPRAIAQRERPSSPVHAFGPLETTC